MKIIEPYDIVKNKKILVKNGDGSFTEVIGVKRIPGTQSKQIRVRDKFNKQWHTNTLRAYLNN